MQCFIALGSINKLIAFPIIGGIFKFIAELLLFNVKSKIYTHPFILGINSGLGMCLSFFPFIIEKIISKRLKKKDANNNNNIQIKGIQIDLYSEKFKKIKKFKYLLIFVSGAFDFLQKFITFYFVDNIENNFWTFDILFLSLFSYFILKTKLYIHQYISLLGIIIFGVILNVINLFDKNPSIESIIIVFSVEITYTFNIVINKYAMNNFFCPPFEISFYEGLFVLILNLILLFSSNKDNFSTYYDSLDSKEIWIFILLMLSRLSFNIFGLLTVKYFTPSHVVILLIVGEISFSFKYKNNYKLYLTIIIFCILLFMLLVFTEIIELNFCELQKYTKKNITERSIEQTLKDALYELNDGLMNKDERNSVGNDDCNDSNIEIEGYEFEMKDCFKNNK